MIEFLFNLVGWSISTLLGLACTVFWIWMIIDCATQETGNDRLVWIIVIVFVPYCGALIYYLVRRPERIRNYGDWQRE